MSFKEEALSELQKAMDSLLEKASFLFQSRSREFERVVKPKFKEFVVYDSESGERKNVSLYRDVMFMQEYALGNFSVVKENGIVLTEDLELAKIEIVRVKSENEEVEKTFLSEVELSDIPMLAVFLESLKIDVER